jgi:predicted SAM-dependent methyltransferase
MLSRFQKNMFFILASPFMRVTGVFYKIFLSRKSIKKSTKVHLGPGQKNYIEDWINIDANIFTGAADLWADLRHPLPFYKNSVDAIFSHHFIEHLPNLNLHFKDVYRCLKPGGVYRFGGPHGDNAIKKFVEGDKGWFSDFPDKRKSIGGRFENFIFCRQEHLTILTYSYLKELLLDAGFEIIYKCTPQNSVFYSKLFNDCLSKEWESDFKVPHTIILEAVKLK